MGTSLSGLTPATTFDGLLKVGDNDPLTATLKAISTGDGTDTILQLSNSALSIGGATTIVSDNTGNDIPFEVNTSSSGLLKIRNLNSATTPILGISHGSQDTRLSMYTTMGFRVQGVGIADMTSSEVRIGGGSGARLAVKGSGASAGTTSLLVQNSAGTQLLKINDDGSGFFGTYLQGQRVYATATGETFPSLSFAGSSGTGMFQPTSGSNVIGFAVSGGEKARLDATGLGIGETTPTARLHIKGSGNDNTTTSLLVQNSDGLDMVKVTDDGIATIGTTGQQGEINLKRPQDGLAIGKIQGTNNGLYLTNQDASNHILIGNSSTRGVSVGDGSASAMGARFGIKGSGASAGTTALLVQNSDGDDMVKVTDDGGAIFKSFGASNSLILDASSGVSALEMQSSNGVQRFRIQATSTSTRFTPNNTDGFTFVGSAIYTSGAFDTPDSSAKLEVKSTTQGFLPPRMTTAQRDAINPVGDPAVSTPAAGLIIYNTDTNTAECWNGSAWMPMF